MTDEATITPKPRRRRLAPGEPVPCPFTVLIDQQEKAPLPFKGISEQPENRDPDSSKDPRFTDAFPFSNVQAGANRQHRLYDIPTRVLHMKTADYSLEINGQRMDSRIVIERKSIPDLFMSVGQKRDRFEAEHQRMAEIVANGGHAFVVIEGTWNDILLRPPINSRLDPKTVHRTCISWMQKYRVFWHPAGGRRQAELSTFRMLEKFYERWVETEKAAKKELAGFTT